MIFSNKNALEMILLQKCIGNDFYYKNALEMIFSNKNALEMIFSNKNALEMILL